jgi:C-methyltransferase
MTLPSGGPPAPVFSGMFRMLFNSLTPSLIHAGVELSVFEALAAGPADAATLARKVGASERGLRLLLNALASIGLLEAAGPTYALTPQARLHLLPGHPAYVGDMVKVYANSWDWKALTTLPEAVRNGGTTMAENLESPGFGYWQDFAANSGAASGRLAFLVGAALEPWLAQRHPFNVLDVGCGSGAFGLSLIARRPDGHVTLVDWDNVLPYAREQAAAMGLSNRITTVAGDMFDVPLGGPHDVVIVANLLHHLTPERGTELLRRVRSAVADDGRVVLVNFLADETPSPEDAGGHLFSILALLWTTGGQAYTPGDYADRLGEAGFNVVASQRVPVLPVGVTIAEPRP